MPLLTTVIGAYPKPDYVPVPDWFRSGTLIGQPTNDYDTFLSQKVPDLEKILDRATCEVVAEQVELGIDIPTDGEMRRENYIHYHCRHLNGIDFNTLTSKVMRNGSWISDVPTVIGPVSTMGSFLVRDWRIAQAVTKCPVKATLPGPLTMTDSLANTHYDDEKSLGQAFAQALNQEIISLAEAGCQWIQVDEPLLARESEKALAYGIDNLEQCFHNVPKRVTRAIHMCCGYPDVLDNEDFHKAGINAYFRLADSLDQTGINAVSLEDAHRHNDLALLERFQNTNIILSVIAIARTKIESVASIKKRLGKL